MSLAFIVSMAETTEERLERRHEVSVQIGDMLMETMTWQNQPHGNYTGVGNEYSRFQEDTNYRYTPHLGVGYQYRINKWLGVGMQIDFQHTSWDRLWFNNKNQEVDRSKENFYNLCFLPTARFTYLRTKYVNLFSSIGLGLDINGGSEDDGMGHKTVATLAFNVGAIGVSANYGQWFASFELGCLCAFTNPNMIYMAGSRLFTLAIGYRL